MPELPDHQHYPGDGGCAGSDCHERWNAVTTHTRTKTEYGPDFCAECSEAIMEWVAWPCARSRCCKRHHFEGCADGYPGCCQRCPINPNPTAPE